MKKYKRHSKPRQSDNIFMSTELYKCTDTKDKNKSQRLSDSLHLWTHALTQTNMHPRTCCNPRVLAIHTPGGKLLVHNQNNKQMALCLAHHFGVTQPKTPTAVTETHLQRAREKEGCGVRANQRWKRQQHGGLVMHKWTHTSEPFLLSALCGVSNRIMKYPCALKGNVTRKNKHKCQMSRCT